MKGVYSCNLQQLKILAEKVARNVKVHDVIALFGDLGAGKTTFSRYFINSFIDAEVTSPTFNLVNLYNVGKFTVWHFDFYRLSGIEEVYNLGIEDAFNTGVTIIEWPKIIQSILPEETVEIFMKNTKKNSIRLIKIK
ncbi:MAG: tRNA (adenosine(37)-N6)-threonylcarbamoyltransferase complex ATPase subunit type 1 TsaE [Rickettsiaceae bacterium H1]|nr:tRNA (adenosine(37)-N6)-threonylcarbamoyltransferase complex ATPase subunit type 1 TsaE [Rickettsiaceae bacterium H1]